MAAPEQPLETEGGFGTGLRRQLQQRRSRHELVPSAAPHRFGEVRIDLTDG